MTTVVNANFDPISQSSLTHFLVIVFYS